MNKNYRWQNEKMLCPSCLVEVSREEAKEAIEGHDSYRCPACGLELLVHVPIFFIQALPFGWCWKRKEKRS